MPTARTRLAPSPTGALHLGNARTFLINWALARQNHWEIVLRIEDLDTPRTKPDADRQAVEDLRWLAWIGTPGLITSWRTGRLTTQRYRNWPTRGRFTPAPAPVKTWRMQ